MAVVTRFRINRRGMDETLKGRRGPVVLHQANIGRRVAARARRLAPRGKGPGPHLADNITSKLVPAAGGGFAVVIVAGVPHALFVSKGTKPHDIGSPVFIYEIGEFRYIGRSPSGAGKPHPGTKRNDFMVRAAEQEGLRIRRVG